MTLIETRPWVHEARQVREMVARTPRGEREKKLQKIASPRSAQTLRRAIAAVEFLEKLEDETYFPAERLEAFPVAAIEYLSRWYKRDPSCALKAGEKLLDGGHTVKTLGEAERNSRTKVFGGGGKALEADYRRSISDKVENIARSLGSVIPPKQTAFKSHGKDVKRNVDFAFLDASKRPLVAFIIVGPYHDTNMYVRRAFDWISRANTLLNIFRFTYLIIPENGNPSIFVRLRSRLNINSEYLRIKKLHSSHQ